MTASVDAQLAALEGMSSEALRSLWGTLTASPVPRVSPAMLRLALGYEIQARAFGGLPRSVTHLLDQLARGSTKTARAITGTRWSGPAFFGLKKRIAA